MKTFILVSSLVISCLAHADSEVCGAYAATDAKMARAIEFLKRYQGSYEYGGCRIELHVCGSFSTQDDRGDMVADLLVTDKRGREFYAPIYFLQAESDRFRYELKNGRIMFHYKYEDRLANPQTSGVESIHLEILSHDQNPALKSLHLGYYLRKDFKEKHHKHRYQWVICEE